MGGGGVVLRLGVGGLGVVGAGEGVELESGVGGGVGVS